MLCLEGRRWRLRWTRAKGWNRSSGYGNCCPYADQVGLSEVELNWLKARFSPDESRVSSRPDPSGINRNEEDVGDSADVAGACSAAKFVVEGAGEEYDAREIEPNRKSRLKQKMKKPSRLAEAR
jgi:hypothetical protein